jgi:exopolyphosphatase/guanosine-5'-triphosphate,3'-diphosphate pyrophosphatase
VSSDAPESGVSTAPIAAIDVGSNTTRLLVARADRGQISALATGSAMTALATGLRPGGTIPAEKMDLVAATVGRMAGEARELGARQVVVACTAPGRMAANAAQLLERLRAAAGVTPRVLSGTEEAELSFRGLMTADAPEPLVAVDPGGGSMEVMVGVSGRLTWATSIPVGVRALTEAFVVNDPPDIDILEPMIAEVRAMIDAVELPVQVAEAVATGGSAAALATLAGDTVLGRDALQRAIDRLVGASAEDLSEATGLEPARVRLCLAGAAVLEAVRRSFGIDALHVSQAGLREGLVLEVAG